MKLFLLLLFLASFAAWVFCLISWFTHDDHAALGWFILSTLLAQYATSVSNRIIRERNRFV